MGILDIRHMDREDFSDLVWKWRCKIMHQQDGIAPNDRSTDAETTEEDDGKANGGLTTRGKDPGFGSEATIKTMYEGKNSTPAYYEWVDYPPKQLSKSAARAQDRVAIKVFKCKDREKPCLAGRFTLKYHEIEIQNPLLVEALETILKKENFHLGINESASFEEPFRQLWFCQEDILALQKRTGASDPVKGYLTLLLKLLDDVFADLRVKRRHLQSSGLIDFKTAWILFPRGVTVYSYGLNAEFLCKVESTKYIQKTEGTFLLIRCKVMMFNGEEFVWINKVLTIEQFEGNMPVRELEHYPLDFHPEADQVRKRCIERGRKVLEFQGLHYRCYSGIAIHTTGEHTEKHNVDGRVLIDQLGYNRYHLAKGNREDEDPKMEKYIPPLERRNKFSPARRLPMPHPPPPSFPVPPADPDEAIETNKTARKRHLSEEQQEANRKDMMSREEELGFMYMMLGGYALKNKLWVEFFVEDVQPMVWNSDAYDHLVYDPQQKDLVLSFVQSHKRNQRTGGPPSKSKQSKAATDDVIQGKGEGLIILLSGPPGTGKTLTAEAVADRTRRPLFYLQAEDLGISAEVLGRNIKRVFEMATEWDAVILLDEADVFMAERHASEIHRNELVSIFLRELEYFRGIIFLTTNLYHTIDSAFRSRVNLHLVFPALTREARESIWQKFLDRLPTQDVKLLSEDGEEQGETDKKSIDAKDIRELSLWQLNGREIKNAVKMVRSWCDHKGYVLTLSRMEHGIKATTGHATKDGDVDSDLYD